MRVFDLPPVLVLRVALLACAVAACAQGVGGSTGTPISTTPTGDDDNATGDDDQNGDDNVNGDSGAFGQNDSGDDDDDAPGREAGADSGGTGAKDGGVDGSNAPICPDMVSGTLIIVEVMIASKAGTDSGEWVELLNPSTTCAVALTNITVTSPRGTGADTATLNDGFKVGPGQTVIVADSLATAVNNGLPGQVYAWNIDDVLANGGDTVTVSRGTDVLSTFTYTGSTAFTDGVSLEYPAGCNIKNVGTLSYWKSATTDYGTATACGTSGTTACEGTPNASNDDVAAVTACE